MRKKLPRSFYNHDAATLAQALIGKIMVRRADGLDLRARIVEAEAYVGPEDLACHAAKGRTARTEVMFGPAGHAYVYLIYGMYDMFNIVAAHEGRAEAVLIRAAEPLGFKANLSGPGRLARGLHISRSDNGLDLTGTSLYLLDSNGPAPRVSRAKRVGVDYAKEWKDALLRFYDADSTSVSKPRPA